MCIEIGHNKPDCSVLDVYEISDPETYAKMQATIFGKDKQPTYPQANLFEHHDVFMGDDKDPFNIDKDDEDFEDKMSNNSI